VPSENNKLLRLLGVSFGVAVIIGGTIGVGILRTPGEVAAQLPSPSLILAAWLLGGLYCALGALSVTELGAALPQAGGFYIYVRRAFGDRAGFAIGWCDFLGQLAAVAFAAITIAEYSTALFPFFRPLFLPIAAGSILAFAVVHWNGLAISARTQELTSFLKAAAFLALVIACFLAPSTPAASLPTPRAGLAPFILAAQAIFYTYDGWYTAIYFTEEDRAPSRNLPRSMLGGVLAVTLIYVLVNAAFLYVLPLHELAHSKLAAASAATIVFGAHGERIITALSLLSIPPLINAVLLMATRILYALSRDRLIALRFDGVHHQGTPRAAMLASCAAAIALVLTGSSERLLAIAGFFYVVNYTSAYVCLIALRRKEPSLPRPFRAWGYPYTTWIVLAISLAFLAGAIAADTQNSLWALLLLALSEPLRRFLTY
jgi:APA family basic amino acid/polyamine antiporter